MPEEQEKTCQGKKQKQFIHHPVLPGILPDLPPFSIRFPCERVRNDSQAEKVFRASSVLSSEDALLNDPEMLLGSLLII